MLKSGQNSFLGNKPVLDSNVHGANMGPTWVLSAPDGSHVGPMNLAIRGIVPLIAKTLWPTSSMLPYGANAGLSLAERFVSA